jgi:hypothetical protein
MKRLRAVGGKLKYNFSHLRKKEKGVIVINSIQKSGTNYMRLLIGNYIFLINNFHSVDYDEMNSAFPNSRERMYSGLYTKVKKNNPIVKTKYKDIIHGHFYMGLNRNKHEKLIFLYRNPLDQIISRFNYKYKNRPSKANLYSSPSEIIDESLLIYMAHFKAIQKIHDDKKSLLKIPYELLIKDPEVILMMVLSYLNIEIDYKIVRQSVEESSINKVLECERKRGQAIHSPDEYAGSFIQSSKVGQWKKEFSQIDVEYIFSKLRENGINPDEFIYDFE